MGDVVNLNKARKARAQRDRRVQAAENRVRHGRTGTERNKASKAAESHVREHDGKRLD